VTTKTTTTEEERFTREQLLRGKRGVEADILRCVLRTGETYTIKEAGALVSARLKKEVRQ
jgi:hypothetical protein